MILMNAISVIALVITNSVSTDQYHSWRVGSWTVVESEENCALGKAIYQNGGTLLALVVSPDDRSYITLKNSHWSIENNSWHDITYRIDGYYWNSMAIGSRPMVFDDASISSNVDNDFIQRFSAGKVFVAYRGGQPIAGFSLHGSAAAVEILHQCSEIVARRLDSASSQAKADSDAREARARVEEWIVNDPFGTPDRAAPTDDLPPMPQPFGDPRHWITDDDYPVGARGFRFRGETAFRLIIDSEGRVADCVVTKSSGSRLLDQTTCTILLRRARFTAPRDSLGRPMPSAWDGIYVWQPK